MQAASNAFSGVPPCMKSPGKRVVGAHFRNWETTARRGKLDAIINHMGNFFDCIQSRRKPISDVDSQHRSVSTCHLGNIAMRVGRPLKWDPAKQTFPGDTEANSHLSRPQRSGFEVV